MLDRFLRYRFERGAQLRRHFHLSGERALFFFPSDEEPLVQGTRVVLEISFAGSEQRCAMHGVVRDASVEPGGVWIELPDSQRMTGLEQASRLARRKQRRVATNLLVAVSSTSPASHLARLLDVSSGSARLGDATVHQGDRLWLRVLGAIPEMPGELGPARVTWTREGEAGVRFVSGAVGRAVVMNLVRRMDALWAAVEVVAHQATCDCEQTGGALEPPLPEHHNGHNHVA